MGRQPLTLLDTHALFWWYASPGRLSARARRAIGQALRHGPISASVISLLELSTAYRRGRLHLERPADAWLEDLRELPELRLEPVTAAIAQAAGALPDTLPGDPADRIIAATAISLGAALVTADRRLRAAPQLTTVW